jgi:hypothetical protein
MTLTGKENNTKDSDFWLKDASYIRLKNMEIAYNLDPQILQRIGVKKMRIFLNGYNLITFDRLKIADPESRTGSDSKYPLTKVYNIGLTLDF